MLIGEIPKDSNIVLGFQLTERRFDMQLHVFQSTITKDKLAIFTEPIMVCGIISRFSQKYQNIEVRYVNVLSGRTHTWIDVCVEYFDKPFPFYRISCEKESLLENRREAIRIPINVKSTCEISNLDGIYPCVIHNISINGIGIDIDLRLAEKKLIHRTVYTTFNDEVLGRSFSILGICVHTTPVEKNLVRCGCEIMAVEPSINEYINTKQTIELLRAANRKTWKKGKTG